MSLAQLILLTIFTIWTAAAYSPSIAKQMAYLSSIAYEPVESISSWSCPDCGKYPLLSVKVFRDNSSKLQGYAGYSVDRGIVVVFRGSDNIENWITNLKAKQIDYSRCTNCKVHDGFYLAWQALQNTVYLQVQELRNQYSTASLSVTGHSLGGAIATLAAVDLKQAFGDIQHLYTFGEPRVGNDQFAAYFQTIATSIRVVHYADIVPHLPWASSGFYHQGTEIWYDKSMTNYVVCSQGQSSNCSNSLPFYNYGTKDHHIAIYVTLPASFYQYFTKTLSDMLESLKSWLSEPKLQKQLVLEEK